MFKSLKAAQAALDQPILFITFVLVTLFGIFMGLFVYIKYKEGDSVYAIMYGIFLTVLGCILRAFWVRWKQHQEHVRMSDKISVES